MSLGELTINQTGLAGQWHLNGNANDTSGNSRNGTLNNGAYQPFLYNQCLEVRNHNNTTETGDSISIATFDITKPFVMAWAYLRSYPTAVDPLYGRAIFSKGLPDTSPNSKNGNYALYVYNDGGSNQNKVLFQFGSGGSKHNIFTVNTPPLNAKCLFWGGLDGTNMYVGFYCPSTRVFEYKSSADAATIPSVSDTVWIGRTTNIGTSYIYYWDGYIDEVNLFDNNVWTPKQLKNYAAWSIGRFTSTP